MSRDTSLICLWACVTAPALCWASILPLALISFTLLRNKANTSQKFLFMSDSSATKLDFWIPCRLRILRTSSSVCCPCVRISDTHSTRFEPLPRFQHSSSSSLFSLALLFSRPSVSALSYSILNPCTVVWSVDLYLEHYCIYRCLFIF